MSEAVSENQSQAGDQRGKEQSGENQRAALPRLHL